MGGKIGGLLKEKVVDVTAEVIKQAPPVTVVGFQLFGYPLSEWVQVATLLYVALQIHVLAKKHFNWYQSLLRWLTGGKNGTNRKGK